MYGTGVSAPNVPIVEPVVDPLSPWTGVTITTLDSHRLTTLEARVELLAAEVKALKDALLADLLAAKPKRKKRKTKKCRNCKRTAPISAGGECSSCGTKDAFR